MVAETIKRGESCIRTLLRRSAVGVTINVKAHPSVEEFMSGLGQGAIVNVGTMGRHWTSPDPKSKEPYDLRAYFLATPLDRLQTEDGLWIGLDRLGGPLIEGREIGMTINLSYLRLMGISGDEGVTFAIKGVYTLDALRKLRDHMVLAQRRFYTQYIMPIELSINMVAEEK